MKQASEPEPAETEISSKLEILKVLNQLEATLKKTGLEADRVISPVRQTVFKRYPVISVMAVTFGVGATYFGLERIITEIDFLNEHPWLIFCLGIVILTLSGKLYQKLD